MRISITAMKVTVVLAFTVGFHLWIVHRDGLLIALTAWGTLALLVIISADQRHSHDDPWTR